MNDSWNKSFQFEACCDIDFDLDLLQGQLILPPGGQQSQDERPPLSQHL